MDLRGVFVPMATPTHGTRRAVDYDRLTGFTKDLVDNDVDGLFPGSSIGEFPSVTGEQNRRIVETVVEAAAGRATIIAGCSDTSVDEVQENVRSAAAAGADAAVVVSPYYLGTTQDGLERFFRTVADDADLPLILYNIPKLTGNELGVDLVARLSSHDAIVGLKDTSGDLTYHYKVINATEGDFHVFQGASKLSTASLDAGADGLVIGPANFFPRQMARLYNAHRREDYETATRLMREVVLPIVSTMSDVPTAAAIKHLIREESTGVGEPLPPLPRLTDDERDTLSACYREVTSRLTDQSVDK